MANEQRFSNYIANSGETAMKKRKRRLDALQKVGTASVISDTETQYIKSSRKQQPFP